VAHLYFDHNVTRHISPTLWAAGHDLLFTRDPGAAHLTDDAHLLAATPAGRVLVTHDRDDFTMLHSAWITWPAAFGLELPPYAGILVLDQSPPPVLAQALTELLTVTPHERLQNRLLRWHRRDGWHLLTTAGQWIPLGPLQE
jgi:hypothetical protein